MFRDRFFMCRPRFYGVEYIINPWMEGNVGRARRKVAEDQWDRLHRELAARADVELIEPVRGLPDMTFTANAGFVLGQTFVPSRFRFQQRQPEVAHFIEWFDRHRYRIAELPSEVTFEGEGDALLQPGEGLLWGGYGVRTSLEAHRYLAETLRLEVVPLRLVDERFYHLDTCFCPLPEGRVFYYPAAFDRDSVASITARVPPERRIEVSAADALAFACNAIAVGRALILPSAGEELRERLVSWGYDVVVAPLGEFVLAGGAAKCLALKLVHDAPRPEPRPPYRLSGVSERLVEVHGHLLDQGVMNRVLDCITDGGGSFEIEMLQPGLRHDQSSWARIRVVAPAPERLSAIVDRLMQIGVQVVGEEADAHLEEVTQAGVAPRDFYATTIFPTDVRVEGSWIRVEGQRMDAAVAVSGGDGERRAGCRLIRDLCAGDRVVCGIDGVRIHPPLRGRRSDVFGFMRSGVSSERRVAAAVERIAWDMERVRERGGKVAVVAGPVVIHTGGAPALASLIRRGYVQALLGGNGLAVHDIEGALFNTSLGIDLERGVAVPGGHQNHLRAINQVRACGSIRAAVEQGVIRRGVMYECVRHGVPFALAGSIRDDGPLPETMMDLVAAQAEYARLIGGVEVILMLASMLHSIGVGNMTPSGVRLICVDISPAVATKLADRGSLEAVGLVTDVGLFLNLLEARLSGNRKETID